MQKVVGMKKLWIGFVCVAAMAGSALAANIFWNGGGENDNWNFGSNWGGTVPGSDDAAFIRLNANPFQNAQHREVGRLAIGINDQVVNLSVGQFGGSLTMGNTTATQNNLGQHTSGTSSVTLQGGAWTAANMTYIGAGPAGSTGHTDFNVEAGALTLAAANIGTQAGTAALNIIGDAATATGNGFTFGSGGTLSFEFGSTGVSQLDLTYLNANTATLAVDLSNYTGALGTYTLVDANRDGAGQELQSVFSTVNVTEGTFAGSYVTQDQATDLITVTIIPEPATISLISLFALASLAVRRLQLR
jgi:hypothetical protein